MKIKLQLLTLAILIFCSSAFAQKDSSKSTSNSYSAHEYFPKKGNIGTSILLNGLIDNIQLNTPTAPLGQNILFVRYYLEDDLVLRMGLGVNFSNYKNETADSVGLTLVSNDSLSRGFTLNISGGIEKHLESSNRLDPYLFSQVNITFVGKQNTEVNGTTESAAGVATSERVIKEDGGFGIGLVVGGGLNYFLAKRFSIGTELGLQIQYSSIGGTTSDNLITTPVNGNPSSVFTSSDDKVNRTEIGVATNALINISYFF